MIVVFVIGLGLRLYRLGEDGGILTTNVYAETELSVIVKLSAEHEAPAFANVLLAAGVLNLIVR
jgi:hypothetical protein